MAPEAILFDEPTSMLDPRSSRELAETFDRLKCLKIIAAHDLAFAVRTCGICIILKDGRIFAHGKTEEVLSDRELLFSAGLI